VVYRPLFDVTVSKARRVSEIGACRCWPEFRGVSGASLLRETGAKQAHLGGIPLLAVHGLGICGESSLSRVGQGAACGDGQFSPVDPWSRLMSHHQRQMHIGVGRARQGIA
jgi:hypothetical protein